DPARLHHVAGYDGDLLLPDRRREPDHRHQLWLHRSEGQAMTDVAFSAPRSSWRVMAGRLLSDPTTLAGIILCTIVLAGALLAPWLAPRDPLEQNILDRLAGPGSDYLLGADQFGRDVLSRLLWGARVSLLVSFLSIAGAVVVGGAIGMVSGYVGGRFDLMTMQVMDVLLSFPSLILGMIMVA